MLKVIPVPAGQDGIIWTLRGHAGNRSQRMSFLNGPRLYGFSRAGMFVPTNPVPQQSSTDDTTTPTATVPVNEDANNEE